MWTITAYLLLNIQHYTLPIYESNGQLLCGMGGVGQPVSSLDHEWLTFTYSE